MLQIDDYTTKPRDVKAVRITAENMAEAAEWCNGTVMGEGDSAYISLKVHRPLNKRQSEGHIGDWLVLQGKNFKVFLPDPFRNGFDKKNMTIQNTPLDLPYAPGSVTESSPIFEQTMKENLVGLPKEVLPVSVYGPVPEQYAPIPIDDEVQPHKRIANAPRAGVRYDLTDIDDIPPMEDRIEKSEFFKQS